MDDLIDFLQWPAMLVTLLGCWWLASSHAGKRMLGFWCMVASNALWIAWGWHDEAYALITLQVGLLALNIRGIVKNEHAEAEPSSDGVTEAR
jgi:hypothetical protein